MYQSGELKNDNAAGVCYNNIANLHLKNGKYKSAALSFNDAIDMAVRCQSTAKGQTNKDYFQRVLAHRKYMLAMTKYKSLRYGHLKHLLKNDEVHQVSQNQTKP